MVKGQVKEISQRPWNDVVLYSFSLTNDRTYYNTGSKKPGVKVGDYIEFEPFKNAKGYWNVKPEDIKSMPTPTEVSAPAAVTMTGRATMGMTKDDYWNRKEARDLENDRQRNIGASRNTAISLVDILLRHETLKLPKTAAEKADAIYGYVEHYAGKLRGVEVPTGEIAAEAPAAPAKADNWE